MDSPLLTATPKHVPHHLAALTPQTFFISSTPSTFTPPTTASILLRSRFNGVSSSFSALLSRSSPPSNRVAGALNTFSNRSAQPHPSTKQTLFFPDSRTAVIVTHGGPMFPWRFTRTTGPLRPSTTCLPRLHNLNSQKIL